MGRTPIRAKLVLDPEARAKLEAIAKSRTEGQARIERAKVLLAYHAGERGAWWAPGLQRKDYEQLTRTGECIIQMVFARILIARFANGYF